MQTEKMGKVKVTKLSDSMLKLTCSVWVWSTFPHFERALIELGRRYKIRSIDRSSSPLRWLVFVE